MKLLNIFIICVFLLWGPVHIVTAQGDPDCDPDAVETWLIERTKWLNATGRTIADGVTVSSGASMLFQHLAAIEALPRPACLDSFMLITYEGYINVFYGLICTVVADNDACMLQLQSRMSAQQAAAAAEYERFEFDRDAYADVLPEDVLLEGAAG